MPGLSQLKQFNKDLLSLGDEITIRASRGEKPVQVIIPKEVEDVNDSEDFVLGMPQIEAEVEAAPVEEDLSDLVGLAAPSTSTGNAEPAPTFEAPDLSSLLNPINIPDDASAGVDMPDLSMFEEPEEPEEEIVEEEPEEVSIADMGLDALLSGGGFDATEEESQQEPETESEPLSLDDFKEIDDIDSLDADIDEITPMEELPQDDGLTELERDLFASEGVDLSAASSPVKEEPSLDDLLGNLDLDTPASDNALENTGDADLDAIFGTESAQEDLAEPEEISDLEDLGGLDDLVDFGAEATENAVPAEEIEEIADDAGLDELEDIGLEETPAEEPADEVLEDLGTEDFGLGDLGDLGAGTEPGAEEQAGSLDDFGLGDIGDFGAEPAMEEAPLEEVPAEESSSEVLEDLGTEDFGLDDLGDLGAGTEPVAEEPVGSLEDFDLGDIGDFGAETEPTAEESAGSLDDFGLGDIGDFGAEPAEEETSLEEVPVEESSNEVLEDLGTEDFGLGDLGDLGAGTEPVAEEPAGSLEDFGLGDIGDFGTEPAEEEAPLEEVPAEEPADEVLEDLGTEDFGLGDLGDLGAGTEPAAEENAGSLEDFGLGDIGDFGAESALEEAPETESFGLDDFGTESVDVPDSMDEAAAPGLDDFNIGDIADAGITDAESGEAGEESFSLDDMDFGSPAESVDFDEGDVIPDYGEDAAESQIDDENQTPEVFDTSEMEGMDFGIPDTDAQLNGDFELGGSDDFAMEGEFEIPGFSDVQTAKEEKSKSAIVSSKDKKGKGKNIDEPDFSDAEESEDLPPNTLSDAQYKQFLKNLGEYPLNVRLAFEDLIVQDEFTDDAEFEVIEKILNKAPARQVASMLEKMLDISIPVPRDFEHRTAEEYEAYKKSLSYQLKNKIIPGILVGIVAILVMWGIFNFTKNCIYKPLKASKLYKQGYALLEADEYPQSEMKFEEAVTYRINKKWFFNYARGYRNHRQYQRAGSMYERILKYYKHDKAAGLEYADMELNDLANYKRAEEIVRREILDYHINDADGILKLGDIFLEWGTEKDPVMLESAREQYATLMQLYGATDLYLSRMMRYFIRSDNLRNVIQMKNTFDNKPKALGADDLTELSGYLLDKYYGPLAPSDEYLRYEIEGLRGLLLNAVKANPNNPISLYNLSKYFIQSGELAGIEPTLQNAIEKFNTIQSMKKRDIYKYIDAYRLLGEHYIDTTDYLKAQEQFAEGISLYTTERDNAGFEGTPEVGKLYADMGNIKYSISGDYDEALMNYKYSVELENDTPSIRYRIGYIQYKNKNYVEALGSFMKAGDGNVKQRNLLLAMANTLSLRGDDYAAQGYYNQLIDSLDTEIAKRGMVFPQASIKDYDVVNTYLSAANNYGVTLYKLAKRTGNSGLNAQAIVQFQQSLRAWDSLTRNQETMVRLPGSNLAEQNIQYITHSIPEFEPAIYTDIAKTLLDNEHL